jgi:hypothetical protein
LRHYANYIYLADISIRYVGTAADVAAENAERR